MKYIQKEFNAIFEEKKSKFIAHLFPYSDFENIMIKLKNEHPKARHFVYAYRYLNEFEQIVENSSDDGEPRGTSGKPSLAVLSGNELINSGVIIVRYFGGVKLGTGGLVRAYSDAVNLVISNSKLHKYKKLIEKTLEVEYSELSKIEYLLNSLNIDIIDKEFHTKVTLRLQSDSDSYTILEKNLPINLSLI